MAEQDWNLDGKDPVDIPAKAYDGKKRVSVYVDIATHRLLKTMSLNEDIPIVHLVEEWIEQKVDLWVKAQLDRKQKAQGAG